MVQEIDWVKMPMKIALERTHEHMGEYPDIYEEISEIYLTEEQAKRMFKILRQK